MTTTKLWWVSVGGNKSEPARVVDNTTVFTIGCPDGINIEDDTVELIELIGDGPLTAKESLAKKLRWERKIERDAKLGIHHSYRKFE